MVQSELVEWPATSPYLNTTVNIWGISSQRVYRNEFQYETVEALINAVPIAWNEITSEELEALHTSTTKRHIQIAQSNGCTTVY